MSSEMASERLARPLGSSEAVLPSSFGTSEPDVTGLVEAAG
jgi:hypothetical protein